MSIQQTINEARQRIEDIRTTQIRNALKYQYISGTRVCEVAGKYGILAEAMTLTKYKDKDIVLFSQRTAKKKGRIRMIALPLDNDPWLPDLIECFQAKKKGPVFSMCDRTLRLHAKKAFKGINYLVEDYALSKETTIEEHERPAVTHYLRKLRQTYMMVVKGFSETERNIFFGWIPKGMGKRYAIDLWLQWNTYIDKLL